MVALIRPERWKVLRVLPIVTDDLAVTDTQFSHFIEVHRALRSIMCPEDNSDMFESYLMIDPRGRFFQNARGLRAIHTANPLDRSEPESLRSNSFLRCQLRFALHGFASGGSIVRYSPDQFIDSLVCQLVKSGWLYNRGRKHGRLRPPSGCPSITVPCTPSDWRAFFNFRTEVRQATAHSDRIALQSNPARGESRT